MLLKKKQRRDKVTAMEGILTIEIIVLTALACFLLFLLVRDKRDRDVWKNAGVRTEYVYYPDPKEIPYPGVSERPVPYYRGYSEAPVPPYPENYGYGMYGGYPEEANAYRADQVMRTAVDVRNSRYGSFPAPEIGVERTYVSPIGREYEMNRTVGSGRRNTGGTYGGRKRTSAARRGSGSFRNSACPPADHAGVRSAVYQNRCHRWRVDFMEMSSGRHVTRDFRDRLVVGRHMPEELESGKLYLSMDATVSRSQFCLFVTKEGVMIENLSRVNITRKNGYPIWQPMRLNEGDVLELGRMRYMVKEIRPSA